MNKTEAYNLLSYHSCRNNDVQNTKWTNGFLGSLLEFEGVLHEENFIDIMECLRVLSGECSKEKIDKEMISDLITILHLGRLWTEKKGDSKPNCLLCDEQAKQLHEWLSIIENTIFNLLQGNNYEAFWEYDKYIKKVNTVNKIKSLPHKRQTLKAI